MTANRRRSAHRLPALLLASTLGLLTACDSAEERVQAHYQRGLAHAEAGETGLAAVELASALRIDEGFLPAHLALGDLFREKGDLRRAAGHFRRVVEAGPAAGEEALRVARRKLARALLELGDAEGAAAQVAAARAAEPTGGDVDPGLDALQAAAELMAGDAETATAVARRALDADPAQLLARIVLVAERIRAGDVAGALSRLEESPTGQLEAGPHAFGLVLIRLRLLERMGDRAAIGAALERLSDLDAGNESVRLAIARWHMQADPPDTDAAEAELRAIAARLPDDPAHALRLVDFLSGVRGDAAARAELEARAAAPGAAPVFSRALAALEARSGERAAAIARMEAVVASTADPEAADAARLMLARLLPDAEDARRAALIEQVLARDPGAVEARVMRAGRRLAAEDHEGAIADLRAALEGAPDSSRIYEMLAVAHARNGAPELAAERRALAVRVSGHAPGPSLRHARALAIEGRTESAESVLLDALRQAPRDRELLAALAQVRLLRRDWEGARTAAEALDEAAANAVESRSAADRLRAAALAGEGRLDETLALLEEGWRARGGSEDLEALVRAYADAGEEGRAEALLRARIDVAPADPRPRLLLARLRAAAGAPDEAEALLRAAVDAAPDDPGPRDALIRFLELRGETDEASAVLRDGLAAQPDDPTLRFHKAVRLEAAGEPEAAIAIYEELYAAAPGNMLVANNLASLIADHRADPAELARAAAIARRLRGAPVPAFQDTYGWTLFKTGDAAGAAAVLRESAEALPGAPMAQHHLAVVYRALGETDRARALLARALELADAGAPYPARKAGEDALAEIAAEETRAADAAEATGR